MQNKLCQPVLLYCRMHGCYWSWKWSCLKGAKFSSFCSSLNVNFRTKKSAPFAMVRVRELKIGTCSNLWVSRTATTITGRTKNGMGGSIETETRMSEKDKEVWRRFLCRIFGLWCMCRIIHPIKGTLTWVQEFIFVELGSLYPLKVNLARS